MDDAAVVSGVHVREAAGSVVQGGLDGVRDKGCWNEVR